MKKPKKLFDKKYICPNCHVEFTTKKPILSRLRVLESEIDGHKIYKDSSPILYEINVCPVCAMAFDDRLNNTIYEEDIHKLLNYFKNVKDFAKYCEKREIDDAIRVSKLALLIADIIDEPHTLRAAQLLKTAWLYREKADIENEKTFLIQAKKTIRACI